MEKIKNIIIALLEICIILAVMLLVIIYISADNTEKNYIKAKACIRSKNYREASQILKNTPHYKDSSELELIILPESLYYMKYNSDANAVNGYKKALGYIDQLIKKNNIKKYFKSLSDLKSSLQFKIEELDVKRQNDLVQTVINESAARIVKGDYYAASERLNSIIPPNGEPDRSELLGYINLLEAVQTNYKRKIKEAISLLDPNYSGVLADQINSLAVQYVAIGEWGGMYHDTSQDLFEKGIIRPGMKTQDVLPMLNTLAADTKLINQYGSFEKISYDKQVLYFDNNILNAIKR